MEEERIDDVIEPILWKMQLPIYSWASGKTLEEIDAHVVPVAIEVGRLTRHGRQILPGDDDMDGFYYCLLTKRAVY